MKISYNWLSKYINIVYTPEELSEKLTMLGIEVENIQYINKFPDTIVVAEILKREPHPNADRLSICSVNAGDETLQIVCGAQNCDAGKKVPLAKIGTLFTGDKSLTIKAAKLRGIESFGMLCSASELGIADSSTGLYELPQDYVLGTPLKNYIQPDVIYDLEITSNRPDWNSFLGIAREIQAISDHKINYPKIDIKNYRGKENFSITVEDNTSCPKYSARIIKNVLVTESPEYLKQALLSIGLRPINNIVDITNFVLFETGQPLHAFDLDKLDGNKIIVRRASNSEKINTLDEKEYSLNNEHLVIADQKKSVAIGGVMGGENTKVDFETKNILLESAYFEPARVKKATKDFSLVSDSSYRFERGIDPAFVEKASNRATDLILQLAGGEIASNLIIEENKELLPTPKKIICRFEKIRKLLGLKISNDEIISIFKKLGLTVENVEQSSCTVISTTYRLDLEREADLAEEVLRIYGLSNLPDTNVYVQISNSFKNDSYSGLENARNQLINLGLTESITYTLIDKKQILKDNLFNEDELFEVINPISAESSAMRPSLLFGMLKTIYRNVSHNIHDLTIFEIGKIYLKSFPEEEKYSCCIALTGRIHPEMYSGEKKNHYNFFDIKGLLQTYLEERSILNYSLQMSKSAIFKKGLSADIIYENKVIASFGEIKNEFTKSFRLKYPLFCAIIELDILLALEKKKTVTTYQAIGIYPSISRDIALTCEQTLSNSTIIECINSVKCNILENIELFDLYYDAKVLGEGKKGLAYSLTYRSSERTLTDLEVNNAHELIRNTLSTKLPVELR